MSRATRHSRPPSSPTACSRAASGSRTRTCGCAIRPSSSGWKGWFAARAKAQVSAVPPMFTPFTLRGVTLANRVVVSPMAQYSCVDGTPDDYYLVHLGSRAHGGAGLVFTEMTCVSADARISPGVRGNVLARAPRAWRRIVDYVHSRTPAKIALQLGHAGPKGSTQLGWEEADEPLPEQNWPLIAPSAIAYGPHNQVPREMTHVDMERVIARVRARGAMGCRMRLRLARAPLRARLPAVGVHLPADQHATTMRTAGRSKTAAAIRSKSFARCAPCGRTNARCRCAFPRTTGRPAATRRTMRWPSRDSSRPRAPTSSTCRRARRHATRGRSTGGCTRRRSRIASATRSASRRWRSVRSSSPITSTAS